VPTLPLSGGNENTARSHTSRETGAGQSVSMKWQNASQAMLCPRCPCHRGRRTRGGGDWCAEEGYQYTRHTRKGCLWMLVCNMCAHACATHSSALRIDHAAVCLAVHYGASFTTPLTLPPAVPLKRFAAVNCGAFEQNSRGQCQRTEEEVDILAQLNALLCIVPWWKVGILIFPI
jgi:hypothetical protein